MRSTHGIFSHFSMLSVAPPCMMTVVMTIMEVVVSIAWRASDTVFLIAKAKDMAPLNPEKSFAVFRKMIFARLVNVPANHNICWKFAGIFGFLPRFKRKVKG